MNKLIERLLVHSGFRWDQTAFIPMIELYESEPVEAQQEFIRAAKNMPLNKYERTIYWGIVSGRAVYRDRRCGNCAIPYRLTVHHKTYQHLGEEHRQMHDLITLCFPCHAARHGRVIAREAAIIQKLDPSVSLEQAMGEFEEDDRQRRAMAYTNRQLRSQFD